jgi:hypothetical protein
MITQEDYIVIAENFLMGVIEELNSMVAQGVPIKTAFQQGGLPAFWHLAYIMGHPDTQHEVIDLTERIRAEIPDLSETVEVQMGIITPAGEDAPAFAYMAGKKAGNAARRPEVMAEIEAVMRKVLIEHGVSLGDLDQMIGAQERLIRAKSGAPVLDSEMQKAIDAEVEKFSAQMDSIFGASPPEGGEA